METALVMLNPRRFRPVHQWLSLAVGISLLAGACAPTATAPSQPTTAPAPAAKPTEAPRPSTVPSPAPALKETPKPAAAASPVAAPAADVNQLYDKAKQEGSVLWYTTFPLDEATPVGEAFSKIYPGVKVEIFRGTGTSLIQRFETEYQANQARADVIQIANMDPMLKWQKDGWLLQHAIPSAAGIPDRWKHEGQWYLEAVVVSCMAYNTSAISTNELPTSFEALADPKWKGKVGTIPPWATGSGLEQAYYMQIKKGIADWASRLSDNQPLLFNTSAELAQAVGRGEVVLGHPLVEYDAPRFRALGAPIGCIYPKDEVPLTVRPATIPKNAPHPNAAQLFLNWRLSDDGQKLMQDKIGYRSVRQGMPSPPGLPQTDQLNLFLPDAASIEKQRPEVVSAWEKLFR
jgi:iron(III) transport system substrate-binding protein